MISSYKFIQKLWILHNEIKDKILDEQNDQENNEEIERFTNQMIEKITSNLEKFNYNVIVANMYETYNYLINNIKNIKNSKNLKRNYKQILICFTPVIPHFTNECLEDLKINDGLNWPKFDKKLIEETNVNVVIQINGKKRSILNTKKGTKQDQLLELAKRDKMVEKYLENKNINKVIFVKNRLINILVNE